MTDKLCEELSFPVLFPKGRFGYTSEQDIKLSPIKYFNARLLHYSGKFETNPEYLFFAQFIMEQNKISDSINIALKKIHGQSVTASQVKSNSKIKLFKIFFCKIKHICFYDKFLAHLLTGKNSCMKW
jgi:hypothetical protein